MKSITIKNKAKDLAIVAVMAALVFVVTFLVAIPIPVSGAAYLNFGDVVIFMSAYLLGRSRTAVAAAAGSMLADVALGAAVYAIPTFIIKGCMGLLAGTLMKNNKFGWYFVACLCAGAVMVLGYAVFEMFFFEKAYAIGGVPFNLIQWGGSTIAACVLFPAVRILKKTTLFMNK